MEVYLIRHTPIYNPDKLCYGQSEIELSPDWELHFDALQEKLGDQVDDAVFYSSPYKRCIQLLEFLSGSKFQKDDRIAEMNFGEWEQQAWTAIEPAALNLWMADYVSFRVPAGESFELMHKRCVGFWDDLIKQNHSKVFIVTHGGVIRSLLANVLNIPLDKVFQLEIDYSSITKITIDRKYSNYQKVHYINR